MLRFSFSIFFLAILQGGLLAAGEYLQWWIVPSFAYGIVGIMALFTLVLFAYLLRMRKTQTEMFSMFYLLSIAIKLMGGLGTIGVIFWLDQPSAFGNAVVFMMAYLLFTGLEVVFLVKEK